MDEGETTVNMTVVDDYVGYMIFVFENGRVAKVDIKSYQTKTNRKKLINAYSSKFPLVDILYVKEDTDILISSTGGRMLLLNTAALQPKTTKDTAGVIVMTQKRGQKVKSAKLYTEGMFNKPHKFRAKNLPAAGNLISADESPEQLKLL